MNNRRKIVTVTVVSLEYVILTAIAVIFLVPLLWTLITSFKTPDRIFTNTPEWMPNPATLQAYWNILDPRGAVTSQGYFIDPFGRYMLNSLIVASSVTAGNLLLCSMGAYAFSHLRFPGRNILFSLCLISLLFPESSKIVPRFIIVRQFGWVDTYLGLIMPNINGAIALFLLRQYFLSIPRELEDAAKVDGASSWKRFWTIILPNAKPALVTVFVLVYQGTWNQFLWPLIVTNSPKLRVATIGLKYLAGNAFMMYNVLMAGAILSLLPITILFIFLSKYYVRGISLTGLKE